MLLKIVGIALQSFYGMLRILRLDMRCTSIVLYPFSDINLFSLIACVVKVFMLGRLRGKTFNPLLSFLYQAFSESLSGKPRRQSIATSAGLLFPISSDISESVKTRLVFINLFCKTVTPVGFSVFAARSIPLVVFKFNLNTPIQIYIFEGSLDMLVSGWHALASSW